MLLTKSPALLPLGLIRRSRGCRGGRSQAQNRKIFSPGSNISYRISSSFNIKSAATSNISWDVCQNSDPIVGSTIDSNLAEHQHYSLNAGDSIWYERHANPDNLINVKISKPIPLKYQSRARVASWNARSIKNKTTVLTDFIASQNLEIMAIIETWLTGNRDDRTLADIANTLNDYDIVHTPRTNSTGGGVAVIFRKGITVTQNVSQ